MKSINTIWALLLTVSTSFADTPLAITAETISRTSYRVHISNQTTNDLTFKIGTIAINGRYIFYNAVSLIFNTLDNKEIRIESNWDNMGFIAGRLSPAYMSLIPSATLSFTLDESNCDFRNLHTNQLASFNVTLNANLDIGMYPSIDYINGILLTNTYSSCQYKIDSQQGGPGYPPQGVGSPDP